METLKKFFPLSFKRTESGKDLAIGIIIYLLLSIAVSAVVGILTFILILTVIGAVLVPVVTLLGTAAGLYCTAGIVIQILVFAKVIKEEEKTEAVAEEKAEETVEAVEAVEAVEEKTEAAVEEKTEE